MRILLIGRTGQVGSELQRSLPVVGQVIPTDRETLDLCDVDAIRRVVREARPTAIVNAAAYTAVDRAESETETAMHINGVAPGVLGEEAKRLGAILVHYSTDYVFDGNKRTPYHEEDLPGPLNVYGRSKLAGERYVEATGCRYLILRTSWVFGARGKNFPATILRLSKIQKRISVVDDQRGTPTFAKDIATVTARLLRMDVPSGLYHLTSAGDTTWYEFAREIVRLAGRRADLVPIPSAEYPTAAQRPQYSVLSNAKIRTVAGITLPEWTMGLRAFMAELGLLVTPLV